MLSTKDIGVLLMIESHCNRIIDKMKNVKEDDFYADIDLQEIIALNLIQIGELTRKLSDSFIKKFNEMPWKEIVGLRNNIVHGYDSLNFKVIWNTIHDNIYELNDYCHNILHDLNIN